MRRKAKRDKEGQTEMEKAKDRKKVIGIIGGMGPMATADLFMRIIELTKAHKDQEHVRVLIDSNTNIPDRTAAILGDGADPAPEIIRSAVLLEKAGAELLIMPCNTAHFFYDRLCGAVGIPVLSIVEETAKKIKAAGCIRALILATDGTVKSKVYEKIFTKHGISSIYPDRKTQEGIMDIIYKGIKAGICDLSRESSDPHREKLIELLKEDVSRLGEFIGNTEKDCGGEVISVLACTELPIAAKSYGLAGTFTDPTENLAKAAILAAGYELMT